MSLLKANNGCHSEVKAAPACKHESEPSEDDGLRSGPQKKEKKKGGGATGQCNIRSRCGQPPSPQEWRCGEKTFPYHLGDLPREAQQF